MLDDLITELVLAEFVQHSRVCLIYIAIFIRAVLWFQGFSHIVHARYIIDNIFELWFDSCPWRR